MGKEKDKNVLDLISRAKEGDLNSFEELYQNYKRLVFKVISRKISDKVMLEELERETHKNVLEKICTYDPEDREFLFFVMNQAKEKIRKYIRNKKREILISALENFFPERTHEEIMEIIKNKEIARTPSISDPERYLVYKEMLEVTFSKGGPPHRLIAFGFSKYLEYGPQFVVRELSQTPLRDLCERLIKEIKEISSLPPGEVDPCFPPLREEMKRKVGEVLDDAESRRIYKHLLNINVGDTTLKDYYRKDPEHNITDWTYKVKIRVFRILSESQIGRERKARKTHNNKVS